MKSRYLAGMSLAVMAAGFAVTLALPGNTFVFLLKGGFEAGLVGAIADWFAVTALFRHPFGIPIPHTSLILRNKEKIVQSLISAMENELLNKQSIEAKLQKMNLLRLLGIYLTQMMAKKATRVAVANGLIKAVQELPLEKAVPLLQSGAASYIRRMNAQDAVEQMIGAMVMGRHDQKALDFVLKETRSWASKRDTRQMLGKLAAEKLSEIKLGGLMGFAVQAFGGMMSEEKMGGMLQDMLLSGIDDVMKEDSAVREKILYEIRIRLFEWSADEERLQALQQQLADRIEGEAVTNFLLGRLEGLRAQLVQTLEEDRDRGGRMIFHLYRSVMRSLGKSPEMVDRLEARLLASLIELVEKNHHRIGQLVKENVDQMDDAALVKMLEDKVGQDLQWIRVNGAICGFVVGIVLSLIQL
ncbi:DUF445 domain-containing protein [Paenibacillus sp. GCM10012307]|uniref:DUF445 domain-containing protein n=1 Tax=Paenibacillus roseus TaxID=2798579 RepID=A0A934J4J3_9BACL|nr:DUF445 domain-containing protein [Paenibacillus roseus]MBJ6362730.1 DUF445 domain-containing protein [Paenibacillus roseus]